MTKHEEELRLYQIIVERCDKAIGKIASRRSGKFTFEAFSFWLSEIEKRAGSEARLQMMQHLEGTRKGGRAYDKLNKKLRALGVEYWHSITEPLAASADGTNN